MNLFIFHSLEIVRSLGCLLGEVKRVTSLTPVGIIFLDRCDLVDVSSRFKHKAVGGVWKGLRNHRCSDQDRTFALAVSLSSLLVFLGCLVSPCVPCLHIPRSRSSILDIHFCLFSSSPLPPKLQYTLGPPQLQHTLGLKYTKPTLHDCSCLHVLSSFFIQLIF